MADVEILDLDELKPKSKYFKLSGKEIEYFPICSGIAFEFMKLKSKFSDWDKTDISDEQASERFKMMAYVCSLVTSRQYEEMDEKWILNNTNFPQLQKMIEIVTGAIIDSLNIVEESETDNKEDTKKKLSSE